MKKNNLNKLNQNDKDWIEEVSNNWQNYLNRWLLDYKNGILKKQNIINVVKKIIKYKINNQKNI